MESFGGFPVLILLSTKTLRGKVVSHKLGSGLFVEMSIRIGRKRLSHFFESMASLAVGKSFCHKFCVSATAKVLIYNVDLT